MNNFIELKWNKLLHRAKIFALVPFVEIVFIAGSMAMGSADEDSDFDLIVGVRTGRIFTVRAFCIFMFGLLGWRRKNGEERRGAKDKFCFSHFVTPEKYCLSEPRNEYWEKLYSSLVPIYGNSEQIQKFYDANAGWIGSVHHCEKSATKRSLQSLAITERRQIKIVTEKMLSGKFGDFLEKWLKNIQIRKIKKSLKTERQYKPRIIFNDGELEFHPDTKRIDEFCQRS